jgi:CspA family cold shock protein
MAFRDQKLVCQECGRTWFFTVTEQRRLAEEIGAENVVAPTLCPSCRHQAEPSRSVREAPKEEKRSAPVAEQPAAADISSDVFLFDEEGIQVKLIGHVKWFSLQKGYGFITMADGQDVFFHRSDVTDRQSSEIQEDQQVEFQVRRTPKGLEAFDVSILPVE